MQTSSKAQFLKYIGNSSLLVISFLSLLSLLLYPLISTNNRALAASKTIAGTVTISGGGVYTGGGTVLVTNQKSGSTATGAILPSGRYSISGLTAPGSQTYRVYLYPIPGYTVLANSIYTTFSSGTSTVNFIISKNAPSGSNNSGSSTSTKYQSITGKVYYTSNGSQIGVQGVNVHIKNTKSPGTADTTTSSNGTYSFTGLIGNTYEVSLTNLPSAYNKVTGTLTVSVPSGGSTTANFIVQKLSGSNGNNNSGSSTSTKYQSITGKVYYTSNGSQIGVQGVNVHIKNTKSPGTADTTTSSNGTYSFTGLIGNTYEVSLTNLPSAYNKVTGTLTVSVPSGGSTTANFIVQKLPSTPKSQSINGKVYYTSNGSQIGVGGIKMKITNMSNGNYDNTTTSSYGTYSFTGLVGNNYSVQIVDLPSTYTATTKILSISIPNGETRVADFMIQKASTPTPTPSYTISGTVTSISDNKPISGVQVRAGIESSGQLFVYNYDTSNSSGRYSINTPLTGPITLRAIPTSSSPFQGSVSYPLITFGPSTTASVVRNFHLTPKSQPKVNLTVKVQAATGITAPLSQVGVNVCYQIPIVIDGRTIDCELSGTGDGTTRVFKIQPNTTVEIQAIAVLEPGRNPSQVKKTVVIGTTDKTEVLTLPLSSSSTFNSKIKICVFNNATLSLPLSAKISIAGYSTVNTDTYGCHDYTFTGGKSISVKAEADGYEAQLKTIVLSQPNMPTEYFYLDQGTSANTGVIYGRVTDQKGYSAAGISVTVSKDGSIVNQTTTNSNGYYITGKLPYGSEYSVSFDNQCFASSTYDSLYLNTNVVGLNRTLERVVNSTCSEPNTSTPNNPTPPSNYPSPEDTYTAPEDNSSDIPSLDPQDPYPSVIPTPTNSTSNPSDPTPTPKPTSKPTSIPTGNQPTTPFPTGLNLTPTPISSPNDLKVLVTLFLHGIGSSGDTANPFPPACQTSPRGSDCLSNQNPIRKIRNIAVQLLDEDGKKVQENLGTISYNTLKGSYEGAVYLKRPKDGYYSMTISSPYYLRQALHKFWYITPSETQFELATTTLVTGDANQDNTLSILDYNLITDCYSDFQAAKSCSSYQKLGADLTDDGKVNQADLNLFLRDFKTQMGD